MAMEQVPFSTSRYPIITYSYDFLQILNINIHHRFKQPITNQMNISIFKRGV